MVEEISVLRDGLRIYGTMQLPDGEGPFGAVVFSHGFGAARVYDSDMGNEYVARGIAFASFDFCGGGPASQSDGSMLDMSVLTEIADLEAVLDAVRAHGKVDARRVFLIGTSLGGFVSACVAGRHPDQVRALVLNFPALCVRDDAEAYVRRFADGKKAPDQYEFGGLVVGKRYLEDALATDVFAEMAGYGGDVLIVHGSDDPVVPVEYSLRAAKVYGEAAELVVLGGMGHGFKQASAKHRRRAMDLALRFVVGHL
ncbi:alpha/beta hydrolase family protein [Slackia heliotrinireducens]|uniref:alpha/beta hydrolase family protein n=1 Tax=Slackia heliotrinireducens TaxID=84110 RepID=UPI00331494B6